MLVLYTAATKAMYWQWASTVSAPREVNGSVIRMTGAFAAKEWDKESPNIIQAQLAVDRTISQGSLPIPLSVAIRIDSLPGDIRPQSFMTTVKAMAGLNCALVELSDGEQRSIITVTVHERFLHAMIGTSRSVTIEFGAKQDHYCRRLACDLWCAVGVVLVKCGQNTHGSRLLAMFSAESNLKHSRAYALSCIELFTSMNQDEAACEAILWLSRCISSHEDFVSQMSSLLVGIYLSIKRARSTWVHTCRTLIHEAQSRFGQEAACSLVFEISANLPADAWGPSLELFNVLEAANPELKNHVSFLDRKTRLHLASGDFSLAAKLLGSIESLGGGHQTYELGVLVLVSQGQFKQASERYEASWQIAPPAGSYLLIGSVACLLADHSSSVPLCDPDSLNCFLEDLANRYSDSNATVASAAYLLIWSMFPGAVHALLQAMLCGLGQVEVSFFIELAIEQALLADGPAFSAMFADYCRDAGIGEDVIDLIDSAFRLKDIEMKTGEIPKELVLPKADGTTETVTPEQLLIRTFGNYEGS